MDGRRAQRRRHRVGTGMRRLGHLGLISFLLAAHTETHIPVVTLILLLIGGVRQKDIKTPTRTYIYK